MQLIDEPRQQEAQHIADRSCEQGKHQRDTNGLDKDLVREEQGGVVGQSYEFRHLYHVEVRKAHRQGHQHRHDGKYQEKQHERSDHEIACLVLLHRQPREPPVFLSGSFANLGSIQGDSLLLFKSLIRGFHAFW